MLRRLSPAVHQQGCHSSFITRFPIHRSGALQQTFYGSPPVCPVLRFSKPCVWKPCNLQAFPDMIHPSTPKSYASWHVQITIATSRKRQHGTYAPALQLCIRLWVCRANSGARAEVPQQGYCIHLLQLCSTAHTFSIRMASRDFSSSSMGECKKVPIIRFCPLHTDCACSTG